MRATTVDLFAGAGGASLGLRNAGYGHVLCLESDPDAVSTLTAAGFPGVLGDVREMMQYESIERVDVLWASPPCQAFSTAGNREGALDDRNGWPWTLDVIDYLRSRGVGPEWVICENVLGLTYHKGDCTGMDVTRCSGCYWEGWIQPEFKKRFGWVGTVVLNAADFGVPQFRRRVFLIAGPRPVRWPERTHCSVEEMTQQTMFGPRLKQWVSIRDALKIEADESLQYQRPFVVEEKPGWWHRESSVDGPSRTIGSRANASVSGPGSEPWRLDGPSHAVMTTEVKGTRGKHIKGRPDRASDTAWLAAGRRRLTWRECSVLQGFPDDYPFQGRTQASIYKQVGNAVCPMVSEVLGRCVLKAMTT
tara:strand:+ start:1943 stop:3028 length:1086 start_codon:yes stop_codon:yes gene_type:complete